MGAGIIKCVNKINIYFSLLMSVEIFVINASLRSKSMTCERLGNLRLDP